MRKNGRTMERIRKNFIGWGAPDSVFLDDENGYLLGAEVEADVENQRHFASLDFDVVVVVEVRQSSLLSSERTRAVDWRARLRA